jgi:hypothetical protein
MHIVIDNCYFFVSNFPLSFPINLLLHSYFLFEIDISFEDIFFLILLFFFFFSYCSVLFCAMRCDAMLSYPIIPPSSTLHSPNTIHHFIKLFLGYLITSYCVTDTRILGVHILLFQFYNSNFKSKIDGI